MAANDKDAASEADRGVDSVAQLQRQLISMAGERYSAVDSDEADTGWLDPNELLSKKDLLGDDGTPGTYFEMRAAHHVIAPVLNAVQRLVTSQTFVVAPCPDLLRMLEPGEQVTARTCALAVEAVLRTAGPIPTQIAQAWDRYRTFGHVCYEIVFNANGLQLHWIPPWQIEDIQTDETGVLLKSVDLNAAAGGESNVPAWKIWWVANKQQPGNFYGLAEIRCLLGLFEAFKQDLQSYLAERRLQRGILYFQEGEDGTNVKSWEVAQQFLMAFFQGKASPLYIPKGLSLGHLQASSPALNAAIGMLSETYDQKILTALDSQLSTLGISGAGSLALGKEVSVKDAEKLQAAITAFLQRLSGRLDPESDLLRKITVLLGFDERYTPVFSMTTKVNEAVDLQGVKDGLAAGYLKWESLGEDNRKRILQALGLSAE
jgi:hypothetical protein